jgi:preprotein translocase subunit SecE
MINPIKSIIEYVRTSIAELKKVTWPTKDATIRYTTMVVVICVALAGVFAVLDLGFSKLITSVLAQTASSQTKAKEEPVTPDVEPIQVETTTPDKNGEVKLDLNQIETTSSQE